MGDLIHLFLGHPGTIPVTSILKLHDFLGVATSDSHIVADADVFQQFHQSPTHVTRVGCLDGRVDQTFSSSHRVEEEFLGIQAAEEGISHKS